MKRIFLIAASAAAVSPVFAVISDFHVICKGAFQDANGSDQIIEAVSRSSGDTLDIAKYPASRQWREEDTLSYPLIDSRDDFPIAWIKARRDANGASDQAYIRIQKGGPEPSPAQLEITSTDPAKTEEDYSLDCYTFTPLPD